MIQQNKTGMRLRQSFKNQNKDTLWLIQTIATVLVCIALILIVIEITGFKAGNALITMTMVSGWLCVIYGILLKSKHSSWFFIGALVLLLSITVICRAQVIEGFRIFRNQASDAMVRGTGYVLPELALQLSAEKSNLCASLFAAVAAGGISILCCALISFVPVVLAILLPIVMMCVMYIFGTDAGFAGVLPVLCVSVMILMYSGWSKRGSLSSVLLSWSLCAVVVVLLMACTSMPSVENRIKETNENLHRRIHEERYETEYTSLPEGDFSDYTETEHKSEQALAVTMDVPQQMYLRGFTGAMFDGENWEALDGDVLVKNKQLLFWINLNAFDQNAQFDAAAAYAQLPKYSITVQNIGACSFYRYIPFSIGVGTWADAENLNTDGVYADGERNYSYSVNGGTSEDVVQVINYLQTSDDPAVLEYRKAESGYRQFVYHHYLQIPEEVKELLLEQWDEIAGEYGGVENLTYQQAQDCALKFLSLCFTEEGIPEDTELPLENAEGTTYQYATVAAMTLRYFGIPARYAEGYVISAEMAAEYENGDTIVVDSSCAKAWVEIYQDGIGWIPLDLTPGIGEMLESSNGDSENSNSPNKETTEKEEDEPKEEEKEQPEPTGGDMVRILIKGVLTGLLIILLILVLLFAVLFIRRKRILNRKEKKFQSENQRDAIAWIYADIAVLLEKLGFNRGNGSMRTLCEPLREKFGEDFAVRFEAAYTLNNIAMFSSQGLEKTERDIVLGFRSNVLQKINTEVKWYKRMWLKWALCMY